MPSQDPAVKLEDLRLQHPELRAKGSEARSGNLSDAPVAGIRGDSKELFNTLASHRVTGHAGRGVHDCHTEQPADQHAACR